MSESLKITIITVVYNSVNTIRDTINSILNQDYNNIEYIIIDGGSDDGTIGVIEEYMDVIDYYISEEDKGIYDAMNKGILAATGDVIGFLHSDDFYPNNSVISTVVNSFIKKQCDAIYGDLVYVDSKETSKIVRCWNAGTYSSSKINNGWMLPHPTFFVKASIYSQFGLYNIELKQSADYKMMLKLLYKYNISVFYISMVLVKMRIGGISNMNLRQRLIANKEDSLAWTMNDLNKPFLIRFKKPLRKVFQFLNIKWI